MAKDIQLHYKSVRVVLLAVMALNWAVAAAKIIFGVLSKSASMTADGFHSFSDGASNIVGLVGIWLACHPKDEDHPYGHKKYETFFSLGIAFLLGIVCFELLEEGFRRLRNPVIPQITPVTFIIMAVTLIINIAVMKYEKNKASQLQSDILLSDSMHTKADILTSLSVIVAFIAIRSGLPIVDAIATLVITGFIGHAAYEIIKASSRVLCDTVVIVDLKKIEEIVLGISGVISCHKIRTRGRPDDVNLDLHVQVSPDMPMAQAHKISFVIESEIKRQLPEVTDIVIHMEPKSR